MGTKTNARGIDFGTGTNQVNSKTIPSGFSPTTYSPSQVSAEGTDKISAHLKGIDVYLAGVGGGAVNALQANGETITLSGLTASTSNDNIIAGLPTGHGIQVGDRIFFQSSTSVQFINYRTYGRNVIEIQDTLFAYVLDTDLTPAGLSGTYDLQIQVDAGPLTSVSFTINGGTDTWADVVTAINAGLSTAGLAATAFFNSPSTLWAGGYSNAQRGILIRSNTFGLGSGMSVQGGSVNDFISGLVSVSYSTSTNTNDSNGTNFDLAVSIGFTFTATTYSVSGPIYNGTFTVIFQAAPGIGLISPALSPDLFGAGYTTQDPTNLSAATAAHSMPGASVNGTVTVSNANDVTYSGTAVTVASITTLDRIKKHFINNGNIGIGTNQPLYPVDVRTDLYYLGNRIAKNNYATTGAPTTSDDANAGYSVGSVWVYSGNIYVCTSATAGNAQWVVQSVANVGGGGGQIYRDTSGGVYNLRTLSAGSNIQLTTNPDDVQISVTGVGTATAAGTVPSGNVTVSGGTPPAMTTDGSYSWYRIGKIVTVHIQINFSTQGIGNTSFEIDVSGLGFPGVQSNAYPTGTVAIDYGAISPQTATCVYVFAGNGHIYSTFPAIGISSLHLTFVWEWSG